MLFVTNNANCSSYTHHIKELFCLPMQNMQYQERLILEKVCAEHPEDYHLINDLVSLQKSKTILMNNNGLQGDIEKRLDNYLNQQ